MLTSLRDAIVAHNSKTKKKGVDIYQEMVLCPTGFCYLDAANGFYHVVRDDKDVPLEYYHNVGTVMGSLNSIIGKSGTGKTSLCVKLAVSIVLPYYIKTLRARYLGYESNEEIFSPIQILDSEKTISMSNVARISQMRKIDRKRLFSINPVTTIEDVRLAIELHIKYKLENMKKIPLPIPDEDGKTIFHFPPSVIITDSISNLTDIEVEDAADYEKIAGNTAGARMARNISTLNTWMVDISSKYNITIFNINHINTKPSMSGFQEAKQYKGLKPGETVKGGERQLYLATNILRLDHAKNVSGENSVTKINLGEGVGGNLIKAQWIKTKTNAMGGTAQIVMLDDCGHDPLVSTVIDAIERGHIKRKGNFWNLDKYPEEKFSRTVGSIREFFTDPDHIDALITQLTPFFVELMSKESDLSEVRKINEKMEALAREEVDEDLLALFNDKLAS